MPNYMRSPNNVHLITLSKNYLLVITKIPVDISIHFSKVIELILKDISIFEYAKMNTFINNNNKFNKKKVVSIMGAT
ncbi:hypothetical protein H5410_001372 [Solanum commersonii]|uniref:Uncharacterized protein n=1 Tax=Solanum commersonii TaxID=4109 RepID=A0A9J6AZY2_SOLCO|nr:hypothetical protein H5410_001372 [Solanum commersonii]